MRFKPASIYNFGLESVDLPPGAIYFVPFFNPASNVDKVSRLRITNAGDDPASVTITGVDDHSRPGLSAVHFDLAGKTSRTLPASVLESGDGVSGALGDDAGKWRLRVTSDAPLRVLNVMESPNGHLTNLSTAPGGRQ